MSVDILIGQNVRIVRALTKWVISTDPTGRQREQSARGLETPVRLMLRTKTFSPLRI